MIEFKECERVNAISVDLRVALKVLKTKDSTKISLLEMVVPYIEKDLQEIKDMLAELKGEDNE